MSDLSEAIRKARGDLTGEEIERMILATHPQSCPCIHHSVAGDANTVEGGGEAPTNEHPIRSFLHGITARLRPGDSRRP